MLDSIVNLCTKLEDFSFKLQAAVPKYKKSRHVDAVIHHSLYDACHG